MHNLEQKVRECPQMLDAELDQVIVEYLFEHFDFFRRHNRHFYVGIMSIKVVIMLSEKVKVFKEGFNFY